MIDDGFDVVVAVGAFVDNADDDVVELALGYRGSAATRGIKHSSQEMCIFVIQSLATAELSIDKPNVAGIALQKTSCAIAEGHKRV